MNEQICAIICIAKSLCRRTTQHEQEDAEEEEPNIDKVYIQCLSSYESSILEQISQVEKIYNSKETLDAYYVSHQSTSLSELPELNEL